MPQRRQFLLWGSAAVSAFFAPSALASSMRALRVAELVASSRVSVIGTGLAQKSRWATVRGHRRIVTLTEVRFDETLRGEAESSSVEVLTLGGSVGDFIQKVSGEACLPVDEPGLLFLRAAAPGVDRVVGLSQGHYPLDLEKAELRRSQHLPHLAGGDSPSAAVRRLHCCPLTRARSLLRGLSP